MASQTKIIKKIRDDYELAGIYEAVLNTGSIEDTESNQDLMPTGWMKQGVYEHQYNTLGFTGYSRPATW